MNRLLLIIFLLLVSLKSIPQSIGPLNPSTAAYSAFGCLACPGGEWIDLQNIQYPDHQFVTAQLAGQSNCFQSVCFYSRILYAYDFGFTIPAGAIITGVKADVLRMSSVSFSIIDTLVKLYTGSAVGTNHADSSYWILAPTTISYGNSNDTWGYALSPDTINSPQFGLAIQITNKNPSGTFVSSSIDNVMMTVYYTMGTGILTQTKSSGKPGFHYNEFNNSIKVFPGSEKILSICLLDAAGKKMFDTGSTAASEPDVIYLPELSKGIYFVQLQTERKVFVEKISIVN